MLEKGILEGQWMNLEKEIDCSEIVEPEHLIIINLTTQSRISAAGVR